MAESARSVFANLRDEFRGLSSELKESLDLRRRLAMLELESDLKQGVFLAILVATALVVVLVGFSVLAVAGGLWLDAVYPIDPVSWLGVLGVAMITLAAVVVWGGWKRFLRKFTGLEQTLEELREDMSWLEEWIGSEEKEK